MLELFEVSENLTYPVCCGGFLHILCERHSESSDIKNKDAKGVGIAMQRSWHVTSLIAIALLHSVILNTICLLYLLTGWRERLAGLALARSHGSQVKHVEPGFGRLESRQGGKRRREWKVLFGDSGEQKQRSSGRKIRGRRERRGSSSSSRGMLEEVTYSYLPL